MSACPPSACETCPAAGAHLRRLGAGGGGHDYVVALAGNPNVGKSTVFNLLTGLRQHTGNWPGKTVSRAEGAFDLDGRRYKIVDLPGTYSLLGASPDEEVAREFLLFGRPDVTLVVADATCLERNFALLLQILQITGRVVLCLNLMDEARARGLDIDARGLARELGIPVVATAARRGEGLDELLAAIRDVAGRDTARTAPPDIMPAGLREPAERLAARIREEFPGSHNPAWVALRLLEGDARIASALRRGEFEAAGTTSAPAEPAADVVREAEAMRWELGPQFQDEIAVKVSREASALAARHVRSAKSASGLSWQRRLDLLLTGRWTGIPAMALLFALVLWITITGANVPSGLLAGVLVDTLHPWLKAQALAAGAWPWLAGLVVDGMYLSAAWVVSVMLPPMAIFFPLFTLLEDLGYLPRVAFNLDRIFQKAGAHGKQALTMTMGLGCNAAGVIATRIIDSPRERLIAIITNNFSLCNGRWPTQILMATIFVGALAPPRFAGLVASAAVFCVAVLGFACALGSSWLLSRTLLKGEASSFSLELPPYRPPDILRTLYTSLIDRTLFVLWRAVVFAVPAGAVIWLIANISLGGHSVAAWMVSGLDPLAWVMGLTGVILVAYIVAIPANEIVVPTILMLTVLLAGAGAADAPGAGVMFETEDNILHGLLTGAGWTTLTAVCLMLFSLLHNPCSTTLYTIYKETGSWRWTALSAAMPLAMGFVACSSVAAIWRALGG